MSSLVEAAIRRRADDLGRWMPSSLPAGLSNWVPYLLEREWRRELELRTVAAGPDRSFFVAANGALLACGKEEKPGLLGLGGGTSQAPCTAVVATPVPSMAGVRIRAVVVCNLAVSEAGQVFACGHSGSLGETGSGANHPLESTLVSALQNHRVSQVVAGPSHSAAVMEDGAHSRGRITKAKLT
jgi:alpha-tubulin suppressor-like RCC1 family protein